MKKLITLATIAIIVLSAMTAFAQKGYRGFVDGAIGYEDVVNAGVHYESFSGGISTAHGYQINNWFIGGGIALLTSSEATHSPSLPIYAEGRYDHSLISRKSFFALTKLGYDPIAEGLYGNFGGGLRIALDHAISAMNIGLNFQIRQESYYNSYDSWNAYGKEWYWGIYASIGIEF